MCTEILEADPTGVQLTQNPAKFLKSFNITPAVQKKILDEHQLITKKRTQRNDALHEPKISAITQASPNYPAPLLDLPEPPAILFVRGTLVESDDPGVAIVGPRASTTYGREVTRRIVEVLAPYVCIISGLALGIDSVAHETAIQSGGRTIGVAGCGLNINYPQGNEKLRSKIPDHGALISAYAPGITASRQNFPERNAIIAGLSQLTIVVEASEKSGSLITARLAGEFGRDIAAVPGDITRLNSRGSNQLLADGAQIITRPEDALLLLERYLELSPPKSDLSSNKASAKKAPNLPHEQATIYSLICHEAKSYEELQSHLVPEQLTMGQFTSALLMLEMGGHILQAPGRVFHPKV
ncbi:MAG: DNA-processing protein DprA [Sumerlaeia bacterium]